MTQRWCQAHLQIKITREQFAPLPNTTWQKGHSRQCICGEPEQRLRQQLCCSLQRWWSSHSSKVQVPPAKLSLWAGCFARLIGTLGVAGGWNYLNWGVAKTGTSEQINDSQLFVIISSGMTTWEKAPFNSSLWQSSSNEFCHSGLRHPLYLAVHPDSRGLQLHPSYPAHGTGN